MMRVRHVQAKPGEYIAVHRQHGGGTGGGGGCLHLLVGIFVLGLVVNMWRELVTLAMICIGVRLILIFRRPLWGFVCWLWAKLSILLGAGGKWIQTWYLQKKHSQLNGSMNRNGISGHSDYGKIRQHRR